MTEKISFVKNMNKVIILASSLAVLLSGCGGGAKKTEQYFPNTFSGSFFEMQYPDELSPKATPDGAVFSGDFEVQVIGYQQPGTKAGIMPNNTDRLSELGITLGNFETDDINGMKAYILDSQLMIAAIFPLTGKMAIVLMVNNQRGTTFGKNAEKMLKSFRITNEKAFPGTITPLETPQTDNRTDSQKTDTQEDKEETEQPKPRPVVEVDTKGLIPGTFYDSDLIFLKLGPGYIVSRSAEYSVNIVGRIPQSQGQQQIDVSFTNPVSITAENLAIQFSGGKKPQKVTLGRNTFQMVTSKDPNSSDIHFLFYCGQYYTCKVVIRGSLGLTGETLEILNSIIFK